MDRVGLVVLKCRDQKMKSIIMKKILLPFLVLFCLHLTAQTKDSGLDNFVFDFEKDFTLAQVDSFQALLSSHNKITGDQIVILSTDNPGEDLSIYADHFGAEHILGDSNRVNSMVLAISIKGKQFVMIPNKKLQTVLTHDILEELVKSGTPELKAHQYFAGVWKVCTAVTDYLRKSKQKP